MEDEMYGVSSTTEYSDGALMTPENIFPAEYHSFLMSSAARIPMFGSDELLSAVTAGNETEPYPGATIAPEIQRQNDASSLIKAKIASHPHYPRLLQAYIDCQKVGAPPEIACLLEEIRRENDVCKRDVVVSTCVEADPELDEFMETYCDMLVKYKSDLTRPFDEATTFLNKIETQLTDLCSGSSLLTLSGSCTGRKTTCYLSFAVLLLHFLLGDVLMFFFSLLEVKSSVNNKDCKEKKKMIFIFYTPFLIYMKIKLIVHKFNEVTQR
ncbi:homeobox protein knotted-1-like 6 isoform X2 [Glycine max]|uniref:homeobox protein knotted-1-like 6 isoform X2 n=1 Tax=Glycine max TaxID=3847 RepID=UPI001B356830|nr:homeobox protein knotted-1-like 6 isoform X2 [Glycine max]